MKSKELKLEIYPITIEIVVFSEKEINKCKDSFSHINHIIDFDETRACVVSNTDHNFMYVFFNKNRNIDHGVISHECFHLVNRICENLGIVYDITENQEAVAYLLQYLVNEVYVFFKENKIIVEDCR